MTPTMSLILVCGLVLLLTVLQWPELAGAVSFSAGWRKKLIRQLVCGGLAGWLIWLVNLTLWRVRVEYWPVLLLLLVEGVALGGLGAALVWAAKRIHIPRNLSRVKPDGISMEEIEKTEKPVEGSTATGLSGTVRVRQRVSIKGALRSGVGLTWDGTTCRWTSLETSPEGEPKSLAG